MSRRISVLCSIWKIASLVESELRQGFRSESALNETILSPQLNPLTINDSEFAAVPQAERCKLTNDIISHQNKYISTGI